MQKDMALKEHLYNVIYDIVRAKETDCRGPCYACLCADILPALGLEYSRHEAETAMESLLRSGRIEYRATANDWLFRPKEKRIYEQLLHT